MLLSAQEISKSYYLGDKRVDVLQDASLQVDTGEVVAVIGASGSGKSTLLHILGSLDHPDAGTVSIAGQDVSRLKPRALDRLRSDEIGFIFQFHFLLPDFSALENVMMPRLVRGEDGAHEADAREWLDRVGLGHRVDHRPSELSGGEQQRVAVARAFMNDPSVVFADEPTGNLDDATGDEIHTLIRELSRERGQSFVVVTHKREFSQFADRTVELVDGALRQVS